MSKHKVRDRKKETTGSGVQPTATTSDNRMSCDYDHDESENLREGFCPQWNCRNPDGSRVELINMGGYLQCGHCYRRYDKC